MEKDRNWSTIVPILVWIACLIITGFRTFLDTTIDLKDCQFWITFFNWFSSNTFSAFISMVVVMMVQFYAIEKNNANGLRIKGEKYSGLSRKNISITIIATVIYYSMAIVDALMSSGATSFIMFLFSITYIILYFNYMKARF